VEKGIIFCIQEKGKSERGKSMGREYKRKQKHHKRREEKEKREKRKKKE